jgi:hypothetical protein
VVNADQQKTPKTVKNLPKERKHSEAPRTIEKAHVNAQLKEWISHFLRQILRETLRDF